MPIPEEKLYRPERLNRWFAVSSILMTLSILWMIDVDYDRPWRGFQDQYFVGKAAIAHLDYLDATRQERVNEIAEAQRRLLDAEELAKSDANKRVELVRAFDDADLEFKKANAPWSKASQLLEVTKDDYERALGQYGADHPVTEAEHKRFLAEEQRVDELRKVKEKWEDAKKHLEGQLHDLDRLVREAQKRVDELEQVAESARQKDMQFRGVLTDSGLLAGLPIVRGIINAPLLDFTAPKNTPGRHQVNQLVLPDVRQRLNYLESYTTDRCTTCHIAIDDPEFSKERLAQKLEQSIPGISEAVQRLGLAAVNPPTPPTLANGVALPAGQVVNQWKELSKKQQDDYFNALLDLVNGYLKTSGRKTLELGQPVLAHPNLDLYLTPDSAHPMTRMGCTVCHEGNPQETDFVQAAHTPSTHRVRERWKDEYYVTRMGIPNITFETIAHYWDRPMRLPEYTEAGCAKCHVEVTDIARFHGERHGSRINLGQQLFREVGCINCHNVDSMKEARRVGPDLRNIRAKLTSPFVQQWVFAPQKFRPATRMPHFFLQENNRSESRNRFDSDPELRTKTEVSAISKYLFAVSNDWKPAPKPEEVRADAARGKQLFRDLGCLACHANFAEFGEEWITKDLVQREGISPETAGHRYKGMTSAQRERYATERFVEHHDSFLRPERAAFDPEKPYNTPIFSRFAPELSGVGSKVSFDWLYAWLLEPREYSPDTKMPSFRLTPAEAADIAAYLMTLRNDEFVQGEFPMDEAAKKMADELILQILAAQRSERRSLAIMNDEGGELSEMLVFGLKDSLDAEAAKKLIKPMALEDKKMMFLGSKMIGHYGCYACHMIRGFEKTTPPGTDLTTWAEKPVTQLDFAFYDDAFETMREEKEDIFGPIYPKDAAQLRQLSPLPGDAHEEITHTHAAFAKHKMLNPRIWDREKIKRPYDKLKMPNFYFTEEESKALTTFLMSRIPPRVHGSLSVDYETELNGPVAKGRTLTRELNCVACHQIEDNVPTIQQYFRREMGGSLVFDVTNAPPLLWGEGAKVQHHWFHGFLQNVIPLRPWLVVRMPSFYLSNEQATTLVEYFAALSQKDARMVAKALGPVDEYIGKSQKPAESAGKSEPTGSSTTKPGAGWFKEPSLARFAEELRDWAVGRKLVRANELDPLQSPRDRVISAHAELLDRVRFLKDLYNVEYPFAEPPVTLHADEHYQLGESFLVDMGCLKCHVLGDMVAGPARNTDEFVQVYRLDAVRGEGPEAVAVLNGKPYPIGSEIDGHKLVSAENKVYASGDVDTKAVIEGPGPGGTPERVMLVAASAPNLGLTHLRLQRNWLANWMLNPQLIQPGTKMPQNFLGGVSPFQEDAKYAAKKDHIKLLIDFLYDAGTKKARVALPKLPAPSESEDFEEGGAGAVFED